MVPEYGYKEFDALPVRWLNGPFDELLEQLSWV
jgi:hypothetical protein